MVAILGRRHVPAVPKSRIKAGGGSHHRAHANRGTGRTQAICAAERRPRVTAPGRYLSITNGRIVRTKSSSPVRCSTSAIISSAQEIVSSKVVSSHRAKTAASLKGCALISLFERVRSGNTGHQRNRQHDDVLLAITIEIPRARQCAFEKTDIPNEMVFLGLCQLHPVVFDNDFDWQPIRLIRQGRLGSRIPREVFPAQLSVVDLGGDGWARVVPSGTASRAIDCHSFSASDS